jgi:hypothetical protein
MLRERLSRLLSNGPQNPRAQQPVHTPRLSDPELVELPKHLVFESGHDIAVARLLNKPES